MIIIDLFSSLHLFLTPRFHTVCQSQHITSGTTTASSRRCGIISNWYCCHCNWYSIQRGHDSRFGSIRNPRGSFLTMSNLLSSPMESKKNSATSVWSDQQNVNCWKNLSFERIASPISNQLIENKQRNLIWPGALWRTSATRSTGRSSTSSSEEHKD